MSVLAVLTIIVIAGVFGGIGNAMITEPERGLMFPRLIQLRTGDRIWRPGFIGNIFVGAIAALVVTGLSGPLGQVPIVFGETAGYNLVMGSTITSALFAGFGGARILTNQLDNKEDKIYEKTEARIRNGLITTLEKKATEQEGKSGASSNEEETH